MSMASDFTKGIEEYKKLKLRLNNPKSRNKNKIILRMDKLKNAYLCLDLDIEKLIK